MKLFIAVLLAIMPLKAYAQDSSVVSSAGIFTQFSIQKDEDGRKVATPRIFFDGFQSYTEKCGGWMFGYGEKKYLELVGGGYCSLFGGFAEASLGAGWETFFTESSSGTAIFGRVAANLRLGGEKLFAEVYYERGNSQSEDWFQGELGTLRLKNFDLGLYAQKGDGFGPRLRTSVPLWSDDAGRSTELRLWAAPMYDFDLAKLRKPQGLLLGGEVVVSLKK
jgi:hypothetical protein